MSTKKGEYSTPNRSYQDKIIPGSDKTFFDNTYERLLKKAGKTLPKISHFDAHEMSKQLTRTRPEYASTFKRETVKYKMGL